MTRSTYLFPDTIIIIFAREPIQGQVKTRLIPSLGKKNATELYQRLLSHAISLHTKENFTDPLGAVARRLAPVELCITPESTVDYFLSMPQSEYFELSFQQGNDLGNRMYNVLNSALENYSKAILVGTDCPFLTTDEVCQAIQSLDSSDMVFSPAQDGGYVLVGAKRLLNGAFDNITWGSEHVMSQTREQLNRLGIQWYELPKQVDIDDESDLRYIAQHTEFKDYINSIYEL